MYAKVLAWPFLKKRRSEELRGGVFKEHSHYLGQHVGHSVVVSEDRRAVAGVEEGPDGSWVGTDGGGEPAGVVV